MLCAEVVLLAKLPFELFLLLVIEGRRFDYDVKVFIEIGVHRLLLWRPVGIEEGNDGAIFYHLLEVVNGDIVAKHALANALGLSEHARSAMATTQGDENAIFEEMIELLIGGHLRHGGAMTAEFLAGGSYGLRRLVWIELLEGTQ